MGRHHVLARLSGKLITTNSTKAQIFESLCDTKFGIAIYHIGNPQEYWFISHQQTLKSICVVCS